MTAEDQLLIGIGYCLLLFVFAFLFRKYQPKKINWLYGYRTTRSMRNDLIWQAANNYASNYLLKIAGYSFLIPAVLYFLFPEHNLLITIILHSLGVISTLLVTELYLDKNFHSNGNPK
ncbi:MAG: SdpI family protein [Bacteroidia bacterium]|nr:SdpI family protein [Bacteroidia bacterium]NNM23849.1 SdpI family protein [Flavobacteriaceae bacterium]